MSSPLPISAPASPPGHPVRAAIMAAVEKLAGFAPVRIVGEPDAADGQNLIDDLHALAAIFDSVIAAVGEYAVSTLGMPHADMKEFCDQVRNAIEGNATFCIETTLRDRLDHAVEDAAERRRAFRRA